MASTMAMATLLVTIVTTTALLKLTAADPVPSPDLTQCQPALRPDNTTAPCCLPVGNIPIIDFAPPPVSTVRVRPAAHLVDEAYISKYERAVEAIKALGPNHPWSHMQQANIHCAYCNGAYNMSGYNVTIQVHGSWLFFPFHRLYLHFYERILGKLIGDDTFAIPFWNWDAPDGMTLPAMYVNSSSTLYDPLRDQSHQPPTVVDLNFNQTAPHNQTAANAIIDTNLRTMYRQIVHASTASLFLGSKYVAGMKPSPGGGSVENAPHNTVHLWTGDSRQKFRENMGQFYSAARDPIFYAHHANIDRMWHLWSTVLPGSNRKVFDDDDWLDASFVFWDENMQLVRARVRDSLDTLKLGYTYQNVSLQWMDCKPMRRAGESEEREVGEGAELPVMLTSAVSVDVKRPKVARSREEKEREEEVLVIDEIELLKGEEAVFDVYVNAGRDAVGPGSANFAGSFVHLPTSGGTKEGTMRTRVLLGIGELMSEINADGDERIVVGLVPRRGGDNVRVGDVRIEYSS